MARRAPTRSRQRKEAEELLGLRLRGLFEVLSRAVHTEMRHHQLTPPLLLTLRLLDEPRSMRYLAEAHQCDASNITGLVDRLEQRGLVQRRASSDDRRVTMVHRTADGDALRTTLAAVALNELAGLNDLDDDELHTLNALLGRFVD